jgi:hypothetical protein
MKAGAVKKVAKAFTSAEIADAIEALTEREEEILDVVGDDIGERLTHLLLGQRIRARMDDGVALKDAFREEMASVRGVLKNDG